MNKFQYISRTLCHVSETILWDQAKDWATKKVPNISFSARIGTGKATYCQHKGRNPHTFILNYGVKMIESKQNRDQAAGWTTGREILERGYFNGKLELPELLAHTACHEFAHVIQLINGWRYQRSSHNEDFYRVLSRIHTSGYADKVLQELNRIWRIKQIDVSFIDRGDGGPIKTPSMFRAGEQVSFISRGKQYFGKVQRPNKKSVSVIVEEDGRRCRWRVPPRILNKL